MRRHRGGADFTHFASLPFIGKQIRNQLSILQNNISQQLNKYNLDQYLTKNNPNLFHLTLSMLTLPHNNQRNKVKQVLQANNKFITQILMGCKLTTKSLGYFTRNNNDRYTKQPRDKFINVIYLDVEDNKEYQKIEQIIDFVIRLFLKQQIIADTDLKSMNIQYDHRINRFKNKKLHITLFRCKGLTQNKDFLEVFQKIQNIFQKKQISIQSFDISTRFQYDQTQFYTPLYRLPIQNQK